jgi:hypothetical protein
MEPTAPTLPPQRRRSPLRFLLIPLLLGAVFLAGWIPATLQAREAKERLTAADLDLRLLRLERSLGVMAAEARRNNFGLASSEASRFFDDTQRLLIEEPFATRPRLRTALTAYAGRRDEIVTRLAASDPATAQLLTDLYLAFDGALQRGQ